MTWSAGTHRSWGDKPNVTGPATRGSHVRAIMQVLEEVPGMLLLRPLLVNFICGALAVTIAGCGGGGGSSSQATVTVDGSTALQPLVTQAATDYMAKHPDVKIDIKGGGSAKGIFDVSSHSV